MIQNHKEMQKACKRMVKPLSRHEKGARFFHGMEDKRNRYTAAQQKRMMKYLSVKD